MEGPAQERMAALQRHDRWLRTVISAQVGEPQALDEVMQEVALAALAQRALPVDSAKLAPWLYRVAVRQSLLYRRRRGRQRKHEARYATTAAGTIERTRSPDPLEWLLSAEREELIRKGLCKLHRREVEILLLKYVECWSYREIARSVGASEAAVEARLHRARGRLRAELTSLCVVESRSR